jgi:hypothetical protein
MSVDECIEPREQSAKEFQADLSDVQAVSYIVGKPIDSPKNPIRSPQNYMRPSYKRWKNGVKDILGADANTPVEVQDWLYQRKKQDSYAPVTIEPKIDGKRQAQITNSNASPLQPYTSSGKILGAATWSVQDMPNGKPGRVKHRNNYSFKPGIRAAAKKWNVSTHTAQQELYQTLETKLTPRTQRESKRTYTSRKPEPINPGLSFKSIRTA